MNILANSAGRHVIPGLDEADSRALAGPKFSRGGIMESVARVTTITSRSDNSFEDAIRVGVDRANQTLRNITGAWVKEQEIKIENGTISAWEVVLEVTFVLD
jgi:flavin-binding protein dodecin